MYVEKPQRNKFSIGKHFRQLKNLRKKDPRAKQIPMPPELEDYYKELVQQGLTVKNLKFALFETSNGLKYPGLIATQKILANTILVKVPVGSLLTTRDAFMSDIQKIFVENPLYFAKRWTSDWEDRMILAYLLYEYQKGKQSRWYNLIRNLPRDIDYAIFWSKQEINYLQDPFISKHIQQQEKRFANDCAQLIKILQNYPQFYNKQTLTKQNVIWLHTHLVTRCFGKYFQYTTMVPFAQLFNHQCVDVYYTMFYYPGNPHDQKQEFYQQKQLLDKEMEEVESSDGSYDAQDFAQIDDNISPQPNAVWELLPQVYGQQVVKDIKSILYHMYTFINFSDSMSIYYVRQILKQLAGTASIQQWQWRKKKCEQIHSLNVAYIRKIKQFYKKIKRKYYTYAITQKQKPSQPSSQKQKDMPQEGVNYFQQEWPKDKFDEFYMLCSTKDQFQVGSQVFFCYGRLPNKLLLMRYGIALEYNKYDHMFVRVEVGGVVGGSQYLGAVAKEIQIKRYQKFKIKRTKLCLQLIAHMRIRTWKYGQNLDKIFTITNYTFQLQILYECLTFFTQLLTHYKHSLQQNQTNLTNKQLSYHQYFALVYKVQQQRIIHDQIRMIKYAMEVVSKVREGKQLKPILREQKQEQRLRDQIIMEGYWRMFEGMGVSL